jgi:hypothetical protein
MAHYCCYCGEINKGSTPSLVFNTNAPLTNIEKLYLTFWQHGTFVLEKTKDDVVTVDEDTIKLTLKQEETLLFSSKYDVEVQLRIKYNSSNSAAVTSAISSFKINEVLKHEVI